MENNQSSRKLSINRVESAKGFQERVKQIVDAINKDKKLFETKKRYLTDNLGELSNMYIELAEKYDEFQDNMDNLNRMIYDRDFINQNLGNDLYYSKQELFNKNQQLQSFAAANHGLRCAVAAHSSAISARDYTIANLNTAVNQYVDDIRALKARENDWEADFERLREEVTKKEVSVDDLSKQLEATLLEKEKISSEFDTVKAEKDSQHVLLAEKATRLNLLEAANSGLTMRAVGFESEVENLKAVITVGNEEKMEVIRQLSASVEHYKFRYEELRRAYVANKVSAGCFGFLK